MNRAVHTNPAIDARIDAAFAAVYGYKTEIPTPATPPAGATPYSGPPGSGATPDMSGATPVVGGWIANPQTLDQFVVAQLHEHIRNVLKTHEATIAPNPQAVAAAQVDTDMPTIIQ